MNGDGQTAVSGRGKHESSTHSLHLLVFQHAQKEWVEYLAYPCNDSICVCNLSIADSDNNFREKRFNHEVGATLQGMLRWR